MIRRCSKWTRTRAARTRSPSRLDEVKIDDWLGAPGGPARLGRPPKLTDAELLTVALAQALLGIRS
ncbi:hypothetical protein [Streptosporangium sp. NPDC006930]|uniref:hypothetical protein n=1 Tax=unclassified Streptosporangium TaxID=2632669 RepID=UPI00341F370D